MMDDYAMQGQYIANMNDLQCFAMSSVPGVIMEIVAQNTLLVQLMLISNQIELIQLPTLLSLHVQRGLHDNLYPGQYINSPTDKNSTFCNSSCTWSTDVAGGNVWFSCVQNYYLWQNQTDAGFNSYTHCDYYYPRRDDHLYQGQYIALTTNCLYSWCNSYCSWCDNENSTKCFACVKTVIWLQLNWEDLQRSDLIVNFKKFYLDLSEVGWSNNWSFVF